MIVPCIVQTISRDETKLSVSLEQLNAFCKVQGRVVIFENAPTNTSTTISPSKDDIVQDFAETFNYSISSNNKTILLSKKFSNLSEIPNITKEECDFYIKQLRKSKIFVHKSKQQLLLDILNSLSENQKTEIIKGVPVSAMKPEQQAICWDMATSFMNPNVNNYFQLIDNFSNSNNDKTLIHWDMHSVNQSEFLTTTLINPLYNTSKPIFDIVYKKNISSQLNLAQEKSAYRFLISEVAAKISDTNPNIEFLFSNGVENKSVIILGDFTNNPEEVIKIICKLNNFQFNIKNTNKKIIFSIDLKPVTYSPQTMNPSNFLKRITPPNIQTYFQSRTTQSLSIHSLKSEDSNYFEYLSNYFYNLNSPQKKEKTILLNDLPEERKQLLVFLVYAKLFEALHFYSLNPPIPAVSEFSNLSIRIKDVVASGRNASQFIMYFPQAKGELVLISFTRYQQ